MGDFSLLREELGKYGLTLSEHQQWQFQTFYEMMVETNKVMNLTAITEFEDVLVKHFLDSLMIVREVNFEKIHSLIDIGTGAGFPGIPLKIMFPSVSMTLLDSLNKRIRFLEEVRSKLGMEDLELIHGRAEEFGGNPRYREKYDLCVSRAVSQLAVLSEYCIPFVKVGGEFISYKSYECEEEVDQGKNAIQLLGAELRKVDRFHIDKEDLGRALVVVKKTYKTKNKYPRKAGMPSKNPL